MYTIEEEKEEELDSLANKMIYPSEGYDAMQSVKLINRIKIDNNKEEEINENGIYRIEPNEGYDLMSNAKIKVLVPQGDYAIENMKYTTINNLGNDIIYPDEDFDAMKSVSYEIKDIPIDNVKLWYGEGKSISNPGLEYGTYYFWNLPFIYKNNQHFWSKYETPQYHWNLLVGYDFVFDHWDFMYEPPKAVYRKIQTFHISYAGDGPLTFQIPRTYQRLLIKLKIPDYSKYWIRYMFMEFYSGDTKIFQWRPYHFNLIKMEDPDDPSKWTKIEGLLNTMIQLQIEYPFRINSKITSNEISVQGKEDDPDQDVEIINIQYTQ